MLQKQLGESEHFLLGLCACEWQPRLCCSAWLWLDDRVLRNNVGIPVTSGRWKGNSACFFGNVFTVPFPTCVSHLRRGTYVRQALGPAVSVGCQRVPAEPDALAACFLAGKARELLRLAAAGWSSREKEGHARCRPVRGSRVLLP